MPEVVKFNTKKGKELFEGMNQKNQYWKISKKNDRNIKKMDITFEDSNQKNQEWEKDFNRKFLLKKPNADEWDWYYWNGEANPLNRKAKPSDVRNFIQDLLSKIKSEAKKEIRNFINQNIIINPQGELDENYNKALYDMLNFLKFTNARTIHPKNT